MILVGIASLALGVKAKNAGMIMLGLSAAVALYLLCGYGAWLSSRRAHTINLKSTLKEAYLGKLNGTVFVNRHPEDYRILDYTNFYLIEGTGYQCSVAADSWDYQGASNLLAVTTNWQFLYINATGATPFHHAPPGY